MGCMAALLALMSGLWITPGLIAYADVVVLKQQNGNPSRTLQGDIIYVNRREVLLKISDGTEVPLIRDSVLEILFSRDRIEISPQTEQRLLSRPALLDPDMYSAPVPAPPVTTANGNYLQGSGNYKTLVSLITERGKVDDETFVLLSRFRGVSSQSTYAGLYNFDNKGTFWVRLPQSIPFQAQFKFALFGKQNNDPSESFAVKARYLNDSGHLLEESPMILYNGGSAGEPFAEWFEHLDGISGLNGRHDITLDVPAGTRTIEMRAASTTNPERHLVGYIGYAQILAPQFARQYGE